MRRTTRRPPHRFAWLLEDLRGEEGYVERSMFGCLAVYLHGRMMLALAARGRDPWQGLLLPTDHERQPALRSEHPALRVHPVLPKWLYLAESSPDFEETACALAELARTDDPRLGVEPGVRAPRRPRRVARRRRSG